MTFTEGLFGPIEGEQRGSAVLDVGGKYRYDLSRSWTDNPSHAVQWIMLNPSTADAAQDDPTLKRCLTFSKSLGFDQMIVNNLFAFRATDPRDLLLAEDPVGPENDEWIGKRAAQADLTIVAWGTGPRRSWQPMRERVSEVLGGLKAASSLSLTRGGAPGHPLYLRKDCVLRPYEDPAHQITLV